MSDAPLVGWLEDPRTFCVLVPEREVRVGETPSIAAGRVLGSIAKSDEENRIMLVIDPRFVEAVDRTKAGLDEHKAERTVELISRELGIFAIGGERFHLRVVFLKQRGENP